MNLNIKLNYKPHQIQKKIHEACDNPSFKFITLLAGRQVGKSYLSKAQLVKWALAKECITWVLSPTDSQSKTYSKSVIKALSSGGLIKSNTNSSGNIKITLVNNSEIYFKSALAGDGLRGATLDYLIVDEAAFIDEEIINVVLGMLITKKDAKILLISTPRGKNWFFNYYNMGQSVDFPNYYSLKGTYLDSPFIDIELIETFKKTMNPALFAQEFLAETIDSSSVFHNVSLLACMSPQPTYKDKVWAGIDVGLVNDKTVVIIFNENSEMIYKDSFTGLDVTQTKDRIVNILKQFNLVKCLIEGNGIGKPLFQLLKPILGNKIDEFITTNTSKNDIINNLIAAFSTQTIRILQDDELINELNSFIFKFSPTGKIQYEARTGFHDDTVMATAIAWYCHHNFKNTFKYSIG